MDDIAGAFRLGPGSGRVVIKTGRAGLAARAGHDLTLELTRWSATVTVPGEDDGGVAKASVTAELDLGSLTAREGTGGAMPLTDRDRREIESTARKVLGTGQARFTSSRVVPAASGGAIEGALTLGGQTRPARLQLVSPAPGRYRGTVTVRQTDFGIKPYSGFFGALKLRDEVVVEVEADLTRAARE